MRVQTALLLAILFSIPVDAVRAESGYVAIEKRLTAEQIKATGLDRLAPEELKLLNSLLSEEQQTVVQATKAESEGRVLGSWLGGKDVEPIASKLKGDFRGWAVGTTFELENSQRWRVIEGQYYIGKPIPNPNVVVSPGKISGWYLRVEGQNPRAKVQRLD